MKTLVNVVTNVALLSGLVFSGIAYADQQRVDERLEVPADVFVKIENMRGDVRISGTDENYAEVKGELDKYATGLTFTLDGSTLSIIVDMEERNNFSGDEATDLSITLPRSAKLSVEGVSTDFWVNDFNSDVRVNSVSGDLEAQNVTGNIRLNSVSGDVQGKNLAGTVQMKSVSGDILDRSNKATTVSYGSTSGDINAASTASEVTAETVSGDIELALDEVKELELRSVSGDAEAYFVLLNNGRVTGESVSGDVALAIRGNVNAKVSAQVSGGGSIVNRLSDARAEESRWGIGASLETTIGSGSGVIEVTTMSGDIRLTKN
ncbi:DUF4097 family beta strand repeat-containing protein [Pseudidiomarina homiensis]|nr:DUF4097 family beta strand repeat-containing protein [Pseudidiomarina homiensis]